jgi:glycosyltransferase involved in cell wall biosynthesis
MATYNGIEHIDEQLESIASELSPADEMIIVDDQSSDGTRECLERKAFGLMPNVTLFVNSKNRGHLQSFKTAVAHATRDIVVLSDQDDVWPAGRLRALVTPIENDLEVSVVIGSLACFSGTYASPTSTVISSPSGRYMGLGFALRMALRRSSIAAFSSAMAYRRTAVRIDRPLVASTFEFWILADALMNGSLTCIDDVVTLRRIHSNNLTRSQPHTKALVGRFRQGAQLAHSRVMRS